MDSRKKGRFDQKKKKEQGKESHYFPLFEKHKLKKYFSNIWESRGEICFTQISWD